MNMQLCVCQTHIDTHTLNILKTKWILTEDTEIEVLQINKLTWTVLWKPGLWCEIQICTSASGSGMQPILLHLIAWKAVLSCGH
jgi:hypothetical protein